jgi:transcriptional regulator with XRE-family HTH domain
MPHDDVRRAELAAFLRSRRARLSPADVGLSPGGRRRTAGLRREEVALLADVGLTWYTWLEQERPIHPSASVLQSIATALRLDAAEREHLLLLGGVEPESPDVAAPEATEWLLHHLDCPAWVITGRFDVVAYNRASALVFGDLSLLPPPSRNVLWLHFTEPHWQRVVVEWEEQLVAFVALFRMSMAEHGGDPAWEGLLTALQGHSAAFRRMWADGRVARWEPRRVDLRTEEGPVPFVTTTYWLAPHRGARMVVFTPADAGADATMGRLLGSDRRPFSAWSPTARTGVCDKGRSVGGLGSGRS